MQADWELSQAFVSDGQGVRVACVLPAPPDTADAYRIVAGTQGGSLWEYGVPSGNLVPISYQHNHAVTAMVANKDIYVTGCKDHVIRVFDHQHTFLFSLEGHEKAVTSLDLWENYLVSGSWDGTAKVWNLSNKSLVVTLPGHENTVSVSVLGSDGPSLLIATGSAGIAQNNAISDHSIRIWSVHLEHGESKVLHKVSNDHDGPIRDVCLSSEGMLASCSNDGTVKLRAVDTGDTLTTLATMVGEAPMLLSLATSSQWLPRGVGGGRTRVCVDKW